MKNTKQRKIVLDIINNSDKHLDAYDIYNISKKHLPKISLGTIYRNLKSLEEENLIQTITLDGIKHYDKKVFHYHFICKKCKSIIDVFSLDLPKINVYDGNIVDDYEVVLKGVCKLCQKEDNYGIKRK